MEWAAFDSLFDFAALSPRLVSGPFVIYSLSWYWRYSFGDGKHPYPQSVALVEKITRSQIAEMVGL